MTPLPTRPPAPTVPFRKAGEERKHMHSANICQSLYCTAWRYSHFALFSHIAHPCLQTSLITYTCLSGLFDLLPMIMSSITPRSLATNKYFPYIAQLYYVIILVASVISVWPIFLKCGVLYLCGILLMQL